MKQRVDSKYNNEFKVVDTEAKAYMLGFLYADGTLYINKNKETSDKYRVSLSLQEKDKHIIDTLGDIFPFFIKGSFDFSKYNINSQVQFSLRYKGKWLFEDLTNLGLVPKKSTVNKNLLFMPKIDKLFLGHFVRGFFDGNGSIYTPKSRPNLRKAELYTTSDTFVKDLLLFFKENNVSPDNIRTRITTKEPIYVLTWLQINSVLKLKHLLYKDSTIFLTRKKEKFDSLKKIDKTDKGISCPNCHFNKVTSNGKRKTTLHIAYRYKCSNCEKQFTVPVPIKKSDELLETPKSFNYQQNVLW